MREFCRIAPDVKLGENVSIYSFVNLYGCSIGDNSRVGAFVEIQKNATLGKNVKVSSHTFICEGVTIEDEVFILRPETLGNVAVGSEDIFPRQPNCDAISRRCPFAQDRNDRQPGGGRRPRQKRQAGRRSRFRQTLQQAGAALLVFGLRVARIDCAGAHIKEITRQLLS